VYEYAKKIKKLKKSIDKGSAKWYFNRARLKRNEQKRVDKQARGMVKYQSAYPNATPVQTQREARRSGFVLERTNDAASEQETKTSGLCSNEVYLVN